MCLLMVVLLVGGCGTALRSTTAQSVKTPSTMPKAKSVDGVALVPITSGLRNQCQRAADVTRTPVPCPELIPEPPPSSEPNFAYCSSDLQCGIPDISGLGGYFLWNQQGFEVPAGYIGVPGENGPGGGPLGHFVVYSARNLDTSIIRHSPPLPVPSYCSTIPGASALMVHGSPANLYECSEGPHGPSTELYLGHELLVWNQNGVTCEVSFHGHSQVNQDLDVAVARATSMVFPTQDRG